MNRLVGKDGTGETTGEVSIKVGWVDGMREMTGGADAFWTSAVRPEGKRGATLEMEIGGGWADG